MTKTIVVTGATGQQGGGVARIMLKTPGWAVRIVTRNTNSDSAKSLVAEGATVVEASFDDVTSLERAFDGAHAIFAVTNFWEHLFSGKTQDQSGQDEEKQAMNLAQAASKCKTLEHYIWSTLPSAKKRTNGKFRVPHCDYKADADDRIRKEFPHLAAKTTFLYFGYYPSNMAFFPMIKPFEMPGAYGKYVQLLPTKSSASIPTSGDMTVSPGIWVRQILANPSKTLGKYAHVCTEVLTFDQMLEIWSSVSGKQAVFVECSLDDYVKMWGVGGKELGEQLKFGEVVNDWNADVEGGYVSMEELGITEDIGFRKALEGLKQLLV